MTRGARKEGLSRRHRFSAQGAFGPVLGSPRKVRGAVALLHVLSGRPRISRFGIALTRRMTPSSVHRNRIKRLAREIFRRHPAKLAGLDLVLALRTKPADVAALGAEIRSLLDQALAKAR